AGTPAIVYNYQVELTVGIEIAHCPRANVIATGGYRKILLDGEIASSVAEPDGHGPGTGGPHNIGNSIAIKVPHRGPVRVDGGGAQENRTLESTVSIAELHQELDVATPVSVLGDHQIELAIPVEVRGSDSDGIAVWLQVIYVCSGGNDSRGEDCALRLSPK